MFIMLDNGIRIFLFSNEGQGGLEIIDFFWLYLEAILFPALSTLPGKKTIHNEPVIVSKSVAS